MIFYQAVESSWSVFDGLAAENLLTQRPEGAEPVLLIWRGPGAVVMGKNQNPWREVHLEALRELGLPLARRISGGGTVYHDPGNLNVSWVVPREEYDSERITRVWMNTLSALGLSPGPGVSGGIRVGTKKVSGAAFCYRRHHVLHHGTLLISANLKRLRQVLSPPRLQVETHAVQSVPASVANLKDLLPGLKEEDVLHHLREQAGKEFGVLRGETELFEQQELAREAELLNQPAWIWDQTPTFTVEVAGMSFKVRKGMASDWSREGVNVKMDPLLFRKASIPHWATRLEMTTEDLQDLLVNAGWKVP